MRRILVGTAGLVVVTLIAMVVLAGASPANHFAPAAPRAAAHLSAASAPASADPVGNATASATFTNKFSIGASPFAILPINVTWTATEVNATITGPNPSNTSYSGGNLTEWLNVSYSATGLLVYSLEVNGSDAASCSSAYTCSYYDNISTVDILTFTGLLGYDQLPAGEYAFSLTSQATNQSASVQNYTYAYTVATTDLVPYKAFGDFLSPIGSVQAGVLTIAGNFSGTYLTGATVTAYNASHGVVYTSGVFSSAPNREYAFAVPWTVSTPGNYTIVLTLTEQWGATYNFTSAVTVTQGVIPTHTYSNSSWGIPGLGPGGSAALLVTLGVIVGIIVMALVGRSLWGSTKPGPAQPWTGEKPAATPAAGPNECPVCHQTFPNADALKEHEKSQHGITS